MNHILSTLLYSSLLFSTLLYSTLLYSALYLAAFLPHLINIPTSPILWSEHKLICASLIHFHHSRGNSLPQHGADPPVRGPFGDKDRDKVGDQEREGGWTVDGPNKALGVQLKHLNLAKGGKSSIKVTNPPIHPRNFSVITSDTWTSFHLLVRNFFTLL